jgi:hypothetical protein
MMSPVHVDPLGSLNSSGTCSCGESSTCYRAGMAESTDVDALKEAHGLTDAQAECVRELVRRVQARATPMLLLREVHAVQYARARTHTHRQRQTRARRAPAIGSYRAHCALPGHARICDALRASACYLLRCVAPWRTALQRVKCVATCCAKCQRAALRCFVLPPRCNVPLLPA